MTFAMQSPAALNLHVWYRSADHNIHYYDIRKLQEGVFVFKGHAKAVSYVKFLNAKELVSAYR